MKHAFGLLAAFVWTGVFAVQPGPRTLTIEDRVRAQGAIERVYYAHQVGATIPFEKVVPPDLLERKVRTYLKQSAALERFWKTPITATMLQRERERMERSTRMPERLRELYAALNQDYFLIEECLVRATLADRLSRNFLAYDERFQEEARNLAQALHERIKCGAVDPLANHPKRTLFVASNDRTGDDSARPNRDGAEVSIPSDQFEQWADDFVRDAESAGSVIEEPDAFRIKILLDRDPDRIRVAVFRIEKQSWDDWWDATKASLDEISVTPASSGVPVRTFDAGTSDCPADDTWDAGTLSAVPDTNSFFTAVWTGTEMVVWGKAGSWQWDQVTAGRYDPETDTWTAATTGISGRRHQTAVWTGSQMIVWGGINLEGNYQLGGRYDPATNTWASMSTLNAPESRESHTAAWTGSVMVVWGGDSTEGVGSRNTGGRYDPTADSWSATSTTDAPSPRTRHTAVWTGTEMIVWGGYDDTTGGRYDPKTDAWSATSTLNAPDPRGSHTAVWSGNVMVVWGGGSNSGGRYDPTTDSWSATATTNAPSPRTSHSAVWTGTEMIVWGGIGGPNPDVNLDTGGRYDPVSDSWSATSTVNAISDSRYQAAVWTGSRMIVWRGRRGARYDPGSDTWTPIASAPAGRSYHAAVWTGSEMIVWGGSQQDNTGGRYNPVTDAWTLTSTGANVPDGHQSPKVVWTGTEMIVWGGDSPPENTGGRYNPISDTWSPTATLNAPSARTGHTVVWSGREMIVWGGSPLNDTGGRYDPATDTWRPTSIAGAPSARYGHFAVWSGSRMVVWGGEVDYDPVSTGGRYDPVTDSWSPVSAAPHTNYAAQGAVWTGIELIVLGSRVHARYDPQTDLWMVAAPLPSAYFGYKTFVWAGSRSVLWEGQTEGFRYNPVADTWAPTSMIGEPSYRRGHTAVWTGKWVIVWGGQRSGYFDLGVGSRYAVTPDDDGDGISACAGDCNESDSTVHPGAIDNCNSIDDNCNGQLDEDPLGVDSDSDSVHNACDNCRFAFNPTQLDSDGDAVGSACDNCALVSNPNQADLDSDARGDVCDNCPAASNAFQDDFDDDQVGDACDNCVFEPNVVQSDFDHDNQGDICDLNDGLIYVYSTDRDYREWQAETGYTGWNSYRGSLALLRATGQYTQAPGSNPLAARDCGLSDVYVFDDLAPGPGEVAFNLVTGVTGGVESSLGTNSAGVPRVNANPCP